MTLITLTRTSLFATLLGGVLFLMYVSAKPVHAQATSTIPLCEIQRNLTIGMTGEDVRCLQRYLNWSGFTLTTFGVGSPGSETSYFGPLTANALARWQSSHASIVLMPLGISAGTGYWGSSSFSHYIGLVRNALGV